MVEKDAIMAEKLDARERVEHKATVTLDFYEFFSPSVIQPDSVILDVATGVGTIPELLGGHVVAMDVSYDILRAGKDICSARWVCGDAREMPFRRGSFDLVTIFAGLMFIPGRDNKAKVLAECLRVLKDKGRLVLIEPKIQDVLSDLPICFDLFWDGKHVREVGVGTRGGGLEQSAEFLIDILQGLGFSVYEERLTSKYFALFCRK